MRWGPIWQSEPHVWVSGQPSCMGFLREQSQDITYSAPSTSVWGCPSPVEEPGASLARFPGGMWRGPRLRESLWGSKVPGRAELCHIRHAACFSRSSTSVKISTQRKGSLCFLPTKTTMGLWEDEQRPLYLGLAPWGLSGKGWGHLHCLPHMELDHGEMSAFVQGPQGDASCGVIFQDRHILHQLSGSSLRIAILPHQCEDL